MSESAASFMMRCLTAALPVLKVGGPFEVNDPRLWSLYKENLKKRRWSRKPTPTGKVVAVCIDRDVLAEFVGRVKAAGHTVEYVNREKVLITPNFK